MKLKRKLTPVTGLIVAGLIGTAFADCIWKMTGCCGVIANQLVGRYGTCQNEIRASGTWCPNDIPTTEGSGQSYSGTKTLTCHGPAAYLDCYGYPHTIPDYIPEPGWVNDYTAVDPAYTCD